VAFRDTCGLYHSYRLLLFDDVILFPPLPRMLLTFNLAKHYFIRCILKYLCRTRIKVTQGHDLNSAIELMCERLKCSLKTQVSSNG